MTTTTYWNSKLGVLIKGENLNSETDLHRGKTHKEKIHREKAHWEKTTVSLQAKERSRNNSFLMSLGRSPYDP